jgi:hypothetical protein
MSRKARCARELPLFVVIASTSTSQVCPHRHTRAVLLAITG